MKSASTCDSVAAVVAEQLLGDILSALHRSGFGSRTRVIRGRSGFDSRLANAGLPASICEVASATPDSTVVIVEAHHQLPAARSLLQSLGLVQIETYLSHTPSSVLLTFAPMHPEQEPAPGSDS